MEEVARELARVADVVGFGHREMETGFPGSEDCRAARKLGAGESDASRLCRGALLSEAAWHIREGHPSVEDFPGGATEGFGMGTAIVGAECQDSLSGRMERVSTDAVCIGPEKEVITGVLAKVIEEDSIHIDQHLLRP